MKMIDKLADYVDACFTGIWIETREPDEAEREIHELSAKKKWTFARWDFASGLMEGENKYDDCAGDPLEPLVRVRSFSKAGTDATTVLLLHNYHLFVKNPMVLQKLFNSIIEAKSYRIFLIVLSPTTEIPLELEKVFVTIDHELPDKAAIKKLADELEEPVTDDSVNAASGLTRYETEGAFALSASRHGTIQPTEIWELKESMLKKSGLLEMYRGKETFKDLGGMETLKDFTRRATQPGRPVKSKGVLLLGVPGTGKSAFAKALGNETSRPTVVLDVGSMFGSLVGQTEGKIRQALKIVDAMAPCILFCDEIEKALSGANSEHQGDNGVTSRLFGTLLTWLNDHESDVFFIGTCNDISRLPPEFSRAERFDGIFFIDLPNDKEKSVIWDQYLKYFKIPIQGIPQDDNWTGAEIKSCCRLAALLDTTLDDAAKNIIPVATTASGKVSALREWASGKCLSASHRGVYKTNREDANSVSKPRRSITKKELAK